ncbi:BTAD domain-containing putative transcriptional regulator [Roseomonas sp. E05]|uniref:BTAD domain-containing putative transcriptional regulator n=1 Tax=Roseomonas sp. E05 TaxID=3046310 RepID=UPI0024B87EA7|nr:BTAD domain-containing putative transcriptional regulator [Roseomonas sp. E05]MDJ0390101.1 BTAD domain-containing putative transcriptional regulator [Roseomonas sp. E05]
MASGTLVETGHGEGSPPAGPGTAPPLPAPLLRLGLIGLMEAWTLSSRTVLPRSRKARALLAVLGMALGQPVPRVRLAELLWSRRGEEQQRGSLRQALHELQAALSGIGTPEGGPLLQSGRDSLLLRGEQVWVDALAVLRAEAEPAALDLLSGTLLPDLDGLDPAFDAWLAQQRAALQEGAATRAAALLAAALGPEAELEAAERLLRIDPTREVAWQTLIRLRLAQGDRGAALTAYEACRALLIGRFGAPPSPQTEALARALRAEAGPPVAAPPIPRQPAQRGARLGVAPLALLGEGVAAHLGIGLAEEIGAALARFRWVFVADSTSLAGQAARDGAEAAARALRLDYLLSGTVQRGGETLRVTLRLTDLRDPPGLVWSQRFDRPAGDLLALQDEVAAAVVARIDPEILLIEANRAAARPASSGAYDLLLRAIPAIHRLDREGFLAAGRWLAEAAALEPDYAQAHAWHAYWHLFLVGQGWAADEAASMQEAERLARHASALDPMDAQALTIHGHVRAFLHHEVREAAELHARALALNPNLAMAWVFSGMAESYLGRHETALAQLGRYAALSPCHPHAFFFDAARGIPLLLLGRHAEAAAVGRACVALRPEFSYPYKTYLSALGHLGAREEAAALRARLLAIEPDFTVAKALRRTPVRGETDRAHYAEGLRLAGLP